MKDTLNGKTVLSPSVNNTVKKLGFFSSESSNLGKELQDLLSCKTEYSFIQSLKGNQPLLEKALFNSEAQSRFNWATISLLIRNDASLTDTILSLNPPCLDKDNVREKLESLSRYETLVAPFRAV